MAGWGPAGGSQYTIWKRAHQVGDKDSQDGHRNRDGEGRHRLEAIRQALLELVASSATYHERMVNGRTAASGEKRMDLSEEIAWFGNMMNFGDILNMDWPLVEIGPRWVFDDSVVGGWHYNQPYTVCGGFHQPYNSRSGRGRVSEPPARQHRISRQRSSGVDPSHP